MTLFVLFSLKIFSLHRGIHQRKSGPAHANKILLRIILEITRIVSIVADYAGDGSLKWLIASWWHKKYWPMQDLNPKHLAWEVEMQLANYAIHEASRADVNQAFNFVIDCNA